MILKLAWGFFYPLMLRNSLFIFILIVQSQISYLKSYLLVGHD